MSLVAGNTFPNWLRRPPPPSSSSLSSSCTSWSFPTSIVLSTAAATAAAAVALAAATALVSHLLPFLLPQRDGWRQRLTRTDDNVAAALDAVVGWFDSIPPLIYDAFVLDMTEVWYRAVLDRLNPGSCVLDVGIGTAGALLRCKDLIMSKNLRIVGIDYNDYYIAAAERAIADAELDGHVRVICMSVYDVDGLRGLSDLIPSLYKDDNEEEEENDDDDEDDEEMVGVSVSEKKVVAAEEEIWQQQQRQKKEEEKKKNTRTVDVHAANDGYGNNGEGNVDTFQKTSPIPNQQQKQQQRRSRRCRRFFDAVYFSGSFSLLPSPSKALDAISSLEDDDGDGGASLRLLHPSRGRVYVTQTYQKRTPLLFGRIKPWIKYVTTIDFGRLVTVEEIVNVYRQSKNLEVEEHGVLEGSLDNYFQAAYLSVLRIKGKSGVDGGRRE